MTRDGIEVMEALVVSTGHVTKEEAETFGFGKAPGEEMGGGLIWDYGWIVYVGRADNFTDMSAFSAGLQGVIKKAWERNLQWIRFDRDADFLEGVATYDW